MSVNVAFRHMEPSEAVKFHLEEKINKLQKYFHDPILAHVTISVEKKIRHQCEITLRAGNFSTGGIEVSENMHTSIDRLIHKIERQAQKHKELTKDHHHKPLAAAVQESI